MQNFRYKSRDSVGNVYTGVKEAVSEEEIILWQKEQGFLVCEIREVKSRFSKKALRPAVLHEFCQELCVMLKSGIPIVKALTIMSTSKSASQKLIPVYKQLIALIKQGMPLSEAMKAQGESFPELVVSVVYSGEISGKMAEVMEQLAEFYEKDVEMRQKISKATVYPKFLCVLTVGIVLLLFTFVLPSIFSSEVFDEASLPVLTVFMKKASEFVTTRWDILIVATLLASWFWAVFTRRPSVKLFTDTFVLNVPKIGSLLKTIYTARFSMTLSYLYSSGVPIATSISVASATITNLYIKKQFEIVNEKVNQGVMLSAAVQNLTCINNRLYHVLSIGEETGRLNEVLEGMSKTFDKEVETSISKIIVLISPLILVIMSVVVCTVMISVLVPIFTMYKNIR